MYIQQHLSRQMPRGTREVKSRAKIEFFSFSNQRLCWQVKTSAAVWHRLRCQVQTVAPAVLTCGRGSVTACCAMCKRVYQWWILNWTLKNSSRLLTRQLSSPLACFCRFVIYHSYIIFFFFLSSSKKIHFECTEYSEITRLCISALICSSLSNVRYLPPPGIS